MRLPRLRWKRAERPNWALPFFAGLLAGAAFVYLSPDAFLTEPGFLGKSSLDRVGRIELNEGLFFLYVLKKRIGTLWLTAILSTTFAGIVTTYLFVLWTGVCGGVVAAVAVMRYGVKGLLLLAGSMMPHFICYAPAFLMLADLGFSVCSRLYYPVRDYSEPYEQKPNRRKLLLRFLLLHGLVIAGTLLESYVNPNLMTELLKIF